MYINRDITPSQLKAVMDYVKIVINAVSKYEKKTDRQYMIHNELFHYMRASWQDHGPDSYKAALLDWLIIRRFARYRSIE